MVVERWTDEMLDALASSVTEMRESITEMRGGMAEMRESITEMRGGMADLKDSVDGLKITSQALLQVAAQSQRDMELMKQDMELMKQDMASVKQRQAETDQRFNVLLEELRYLIRGNQEN